MSRCDRDSYTGELFPVPKHSNIKGLWNPREAFFREREMIRSQYGVHPRPTGWLVKRLDCPEKFLPIFETQGEAIAVCDWLVRNNEIVLEAIGWLKIGNGLPYIELITTVHEVAQQEQFLDSITVREPTEGGYVPPLRS